MRTISINTKILLFLLVACLLLGAAPALAADNELTLSMISARTQKLNPLVPEEREFQSLTALIYEGLYSIDDDYMPQENLALKCDIDGDTWLITLRSDAKFHDGSPVTAQDVVATINEILRLAEEGKGQYAQLKYIIKSVSLNDKTSLVLKVNRPYFGTYYALTFPILPESQVQADNPVGSGPYKVDSFIPENHLHLSASPYWRGKTPVIQNISVGFVKKNNELLSEYEFNRVDAAITRSASSGQYQTGISNMNIPYRTNQLETLLINNISKPTNDEQVRKAIRYALDIDSIARHCYNGTAIRTDTPMPYGTWMYTTNESYYEYNPEKAKALLAEAGWADLDGDGYLDKYENNEKVTLSLRLMVYEEQADAVRIPAANMIKNMLAQVGIQVNISVVKFDEALNKLSHCNFSMCLAAFQMDAVPDPGFLLMSSNTGNYGLYKSSEMDKLFKQLRVTMDENEYKSLLHRIQDQFGQDCPFICLYYRSGALLTRDVFTNARDIREPEILRGIEDIVN